MSGTMHKRDVVIAAGMPRAGSSWLYRNMALHPHANTSKLKEINYFSINYERGIDWFDSMYEDKGSAPRFDISPFYFLDPDFITHVKDSGLDPKLILILREPNHWIKSFYYQIKSFTINMPPFAEFIKEHSIKFDNRSKVVHLSEIDYLARVNELISAFKGRMLLVNFDLVANNPLQLLQEIEQFTGLPEFFTSSNIISTQVNASQAQFRWFYYLSTNRYLREIARRLPAAGLVKFIQSRLYKEGKNNLAGIASDKNITDKNKYQLLANEKDIDIMFPPVFKQAFFQNGDLVHV